MDGDRGAFGRIVRARRKQLKLTQEDLAERLGKNRAYFAQLETGRILLPEPELRRRLAEALGYTDAELLRLAGYEYAPENPPTPEQVSAIITGKFVPFEDDDMDYLARINELLPLLDERQTRYLAHQIEFMLDLRKW